MTDGIKFQVSVLFYGITLIIQWFQKDTTCEVKNLQYSPLSQGNKNEPEVKVSMLQIKCLKCPGNRKCRVATWIKHIGLGILHDVIHIIEIIPFKTHLTKQQQHNNNSHKQSIAFCLKNDKIAEVNCWGKRRFVGMVSSVLFCCCYCCFSLKGMHPVGERTNICSSNAWTKIILLRYLY